MVASGLVTFREGLEAALIVGILLAYLRRVGGAGLTRYVWSGASLAGITSAALAIALTAIGRGLEDPYEALFEAVTMLFAVVIMTWMVFWMKYQSNFLKRDLEAKTLAALSRGARMAIFGLSFLAVLREGIETALFLAASAFAEDGPSTTTGALIGLALAIVVGYAVYGMSLRVNIQSFFRATGVLLLVFAAGLFAHATHEFQEIGWLPMLSETAWDTTWILGNGSFLGALLRALVGYNARPTVLEVVSYVSYWVALLLSTRWWAMRTRSVHTRPTTIG